MSLKLIFKDIQLITFDVHNVLLTVRNGAQHHYARLARQHLGIQAIDESLLRSNLIRAFRALNISHPGYGIHTGISSRQWWAQLIEYTFTDYHLSSKQLENLSRIIYDEFAKGELWEKNPQADHVLSNLKAKKILGAISNFDERLESLLEQHGLRQYFQFVLTPRNSGLYKPQKEIFSRAANLAKLDSNTKLCHIGDDVQLDYRAAQSTHCRVLLLSKDEKSKATLLNEHSDIDKSHIILNLEELLPLFI